MSFVSFTIISPIPVLVRKVPSTKSNDTGACSNMIF